MLYKPPLRHPLIMSINSRIIQLAEQVREGSRSFHLVVDAGNLLALMAYELAHSFKTVDVCIGGDHRGPHVMWLDSRPPFVIRVVLLHALLGPLQSFGNGF